MTDKSVTTEIKAGLSAQSGFDAHPATKSKTTTKKTKLQKAISKGMKFWWAKRKAK